MNLHHRVQRNLSCIYLSRLGLEAQMMKTLSTMAANQKLIKHSAFISKGNLSVLNVVFHTWNMWKVEISHGKLLALNI